LSIIDGFLPLLLMDHGAYEVKPSRFSTALYTSVKNPTILKGLDSYMF
jgi:hypothetical protein